MSVDAAVGIETLASILTRSANPNEFLLRFSKESRPQVAHIADLARRILSLNEIKDPQSLIKMAGSRFIKTSVLETWQILNRQRLETSAEYLGQIASTFAVFVGANLLTRTKEFSSNPQLWELLKNDLIGLELRIPAADYDAYTNFQNAIRREVAPEIQGIMGEVKACRILQMLGYNPELSGLTEDLKNIDLTIQSKGRKVNVQVKTNPTPDLVSCWLAEEKLWIRFTLPRVFNSAGVFNSRGVRDAMSSIENEKAFLETKIPKILTA